MLEHFAVLLEPGPGLFHPNYSGHSSCFARSEHREIKGGHTLTLALLWAIGLKGNIQHCHETVTKISRISNAYYVLNEAKLVTDINFASWPWLSAWCKLPCVQIETQLGLEEELSLGCKRKTINMLLWLGRCLSRPEWLHLSFEVLPPLKRLHLSTGLHLFLLFVLALG